MKVETITIFTGLASGALLTAFVLAVWDGFRQVTGVGRAVQVVSWLAGLFLLLGTLLAWLDTRVFFGLPLAAALAAPQGLPRRSSWINALPLLPPLALTGVGLFWTPAAVNGSLFVALAAGICAGLGTRALAQALCAFAGEIPTDEWPGLATYTLLTLLAGGLALANLARRGTLWSGSVAEGRLAVAWLVWSAARFVPRDRTRLWAGMIVVAAVALIVLVV